jgi:gas vesicle protein
MGSNRTMHDCAAIALTLVIGGLIGATFGVLFAPRRGSEIRENALEKVKESARKLKETVSRKKE